MQRDGDLAELLSKHGQEHLLAFWPQLDPPARLRLRREIEAIDFDQLDQLIRELVLGQQTSEPIHPDDVSPVEFERLPHTDSERVARRRAFDRGEAMLAEGLVAAVLVAGGQGTRLGFDGPKGTYPIGPISGASLFQIHAEKLLALSRRYGKPIPLYLMTSPENDAATRSFFHQHHNFGLESVRFFQQGQMPAVDRWTGKILMASRDHLALSPDGHGGTISALARQDADGQPSCLQEMKDRGIRTLFYFQVDNPLVQICDPAFLGLHALADSQISFKVVEKVLADERVGVVVKVAGRPQVIEYSDLDPQLAEARDPDGSLRFRAGSIAIHCFQLSFLEALASGDSRLPFHRALKKVPHIDPAGIPVLPDQPNAIKFESFIFDALPRADRWMIMETDRAKEFEPLKNATGPDSPATVRQRLSDLFAEWLEIAGADVMRRPDGSVPFGIEISPLFALDPSELKGKIPPGLVVDRPLYLAP